MNLPVGSQGREQTEQVRCEAGLDVASEISGQASSCSELRMYGARAVTRHSQNATTVRTVDAVEDGFEVIALPGVLCSTQPAAAVSGSSERQAALATSLQYLEIY